MNQKLAVFFILLLINPVSSFAAGWELYDNFSSGTLDSSKWENRSDVSDITVDDGRIKIVHPIDTPNQSGYLNLIQDNENILGIKVTVTISTCSGDVRARIAGSHRNIGENSIWSTIQLNPGSERIYTTTGLEGPAPDYNWIQGTHYAQFKRPLDILGVSYIASMIFDTDQITYEIEGLGTITYKYDSTSSPGSNLLKAIGTRSYNGEGPCTVYFDDVYVVRP